MLAKALAAKRLVFTSSPDLISTGGPVIITIGTPIDEFLNPVRRVRAGIASTACCRALADGQLLILRSTVFPGTTDWLTSYLERRDANCRWRSVRSAWCRASA